MSTNDHDKLIAKIQHFYDIMHDQLSTISNELIESPTNTLNIGKQDILNTLVDSYHQIFHNFLYPE